MKAHSELGLPEDKLTFQMRGTSVPGSPIPFVEDLFRTCSYCGSIDAPTMLVALTTKGTHYSGSDWKYGWPHKFYVDIPCEPYQLVTGSRSHKGTTTYDVGEARTRHHKFYSIHLLDATEDQLEVWNWVAAKLLGVKFKVLEGDQFRYAAVGAGFQAYGKVGSSEGVVVPDWFINNKW